jgi:hypothetical protein
MKLYPNCAYLQHTYSNLLLDINHLTQSLFHNRLLNIPVTHANGHFSELMGYEKVKQETQYSTEYTM